MNLCVELVDVATLKDYSTNIYIFRIDTEISPRYCVDRADPRS